MGVPAVKLCGVDVVTVTIVDAAIPSPEMILPILIGSVAKAPTISHSGRCFENPRELTGYFWSISLPDAVRNALETFP